MHQSYTGMDMARTADLADWHAHDHLVRKEFTDLAEQASPDRNH
ncbi:hypothetical protein QEH56_24125 [Pelagicoccus enzymogenes]|nr:hypothetical protein [Pelagicoccus enzymogenes]MDQ8201269.1 hypothetical protein [Pelagicoccus enzymogenes]